MPRYFVTVTLTVNTTVKVIADSIEAAEAQALETVEIQSGDCADFKEVITVDEVKG